MTLHPIDVIGVGPDGVAGLRPELRERVFEADFLAGGERHLAGFPESPAERFVVKNNLAELGHELEQRAKQRCVVLASGDPLFYGIGVWLLERFGPEALRIEPAVSSMQLAFARAGLSWQDAAIASVHGRDLRSTLLPLLGKPLIGLFTQDGDSPAAIAAFFLEHRCTGYVVWVAEDLGTANESLKHFELEHLHGKTFAPLNIVILRRRQAPSPTIKLLDIAIPPALQSIPLRCFSPGVPDRLFIRPATEPEVMTHQEVRAVIVSKVPLTARGDVVWEIGAGLGSVTVELALCLPHAEVFAVEKDGTRFGYLKANLQLFEAYNVLVHQGVAPEALTAFPPPRLIFLGGSGGRLPEILEYCSPRLEPLGTFMADFVTLENLAFTLEYFKKLGWWVDVTELSVARRQELAGLTTMKPLRRVFILEATKPEKTA